MKPYPRNAWNHAFASGQVMLAPARESARQDGLVGWLEQAYAAFCLRRVWSQFRAQAVLGDGVRLGLDARLINENERAAVSLGNHAIVRGMIHVHRTGQVQIGEECYIGDDTILYSSKGISIGAGTLLAHNVQVFDNTTHPLDAGQRRAHFRAMLGLQKKQAVSIPAAPITIGNDCWIGTGSIILKGVTIGDRSIIAAGAVVTKDVPTDHILFGQGAPVLRSLSGAQAKAGGAA